MNDDKLRQLIISAIQEVVPEFEENDIDFEEEIREECDIDSMDYLNFLATLKKSSGVNIPEADYPQVNTLNKMLEYMSDKVS